jgi:hypothetical protein
MDDTRKFALELAAASLLGAPASAIVEAAEAFHAFLTRVPTSRVSVVPIPQQYDLSRSDLSPATRIERDADNIPTRLVRRDDLPPDAA